MKDTINRLNLLSKKELEQEYLITFGYFAPKSYTKSYLIKEIIWREKYNKIPEDLQNRINKLVNEYEKTK